MLGQCIQISRSRYRLGHYREFMTSFSKQYNICCPMTTLRNSITRIDKAWITNGLNNAGHKK